MTVVDEAPLDAGMVDGPAASGLVAWELVDLERAPVVVELVSVRFEVLAEGEFVPRPISDRAVVNPDVWVGPGLDMG